MASPALAKLKAFQRLDASGRIVPGQVVLRKSRPRNGRWIELTVSPCCDYVAPTVSSLALSADPTSIEVGATSTLTVTATMSDESTSDVTATATYSSSDEAIATVATDGTINGIAEGTATITVTYQGKATTVDVTVVAAA